MMRKTIIVLAASVAMGMAHMTSDALAASRSGGSMSGTHSNSGSSARGASIGGKSAAVRAPSATGAINSPRMTGTTRFSSNNWSGGWRHRHHRFHNRFVIGAPFAYAAYDSCYTPCAAYGRRGAGDGTVSMSAIIRTTDNAGGTGGWQTAGPASALNSWRRVRSTSAMSAIGGGFNRSLQHRS